MPVNPATKNFAELDTYAIDEAHQEAFGTGFGDLTVHEVATHPTDASRSYLSYYAGGLRALEIQGTELVEVGGYLDPDGDNFWVVEVFERDGETIILGSDRDSGGMDLRGHQRLTLVRPHHERRPGQSPGLRAFWNGRPKAAASSA